MTDSTWQMAIGHKRACSAEAQHVHVVQLTDPKTINSNAFREQLNNNKKV